jgi:hypothetical protein
MLYIANCSTQRQELPLRVPEKKQPVYYVIENGEQIEIGKDWNSTQYDEVVRQLDRRGARYISAISQRVLVFDGLVYSDKAVPETKIQQGYEETVKSQEARSEKALRATVQAFDKEVRGKSKGNRDKAPRRVEMEFEAEQTPSNRARVVYEDGHQVEVG